jgi:outer membrane lipoprotein SlyB
MVNCIFIIAHWRAGMTYFKRCSRVLVFAAALCATSSTWAQTGVSYGKITAVKLLTVENAQAQTGGALVGGAIGLLSGRGHSSSNKALRAVAGGVAGQQVAKLASSKQAFEYTILMGGTSTTTVVTDEAGMRVGDCVAVERGSYVNLRLAADAQCASGAKPSANASREAEACTKAKDELLAAKDDASFDRAERKVRLLCVD